VAETPGLRVTRGHKDLPVRKVPKAFRVWQVFKVPRVLKAPKDLRARRVRREIRAKLQP